MGRFLYPISFADERERLVCTCGCDAFMVLRGWFVCYGCAKPMDFNGVE